MKKNEELKKILSKLDFNLTSRIPVIYQTETSECGLACLAMISNFYGKKLDIITMRQKFNISSRGTSVKSLKSIANDLGMTSRALSIELDEIDKIKMPCILHWQFNHFVTLVKAGRKGYTIIDPERGRRLVKKEEFSNDFTGVVLELWPSTNFDKEKVIQRLSLSKLISNISGLKKTLFKLILLSFTIEFLSLIIPIGTQLVMDHVIPSSDKGLLNIICIALSFFIILRAFISMFTAWSALVMGVLINIQWQSGFFKHLLSLPISYFERRRVGDIQSRFQSLSIIQKTLTAGMISAILDLTMVTGLSVMLFLYGGTLTYIVILFTFIFIFIRIVTYPYYRNLSEESIVNQAKINSFFTETLYGITSIKIQNLLEKRVGRWLDIQSDNANVGFKLTRMDAVFGGINTFISTFEQILILWLGVNQVMDNKITLGMFIAFNSFRSQFSSRIFSLINFILELRMLSLHNERISDIALAEKEQVNNNYSWVADNTPYSIELKNLMFRYDETLNPVISNFNLNVNAGECVAITGASGSGKSTLIKIMSGLYLPVGGQVLVNGVEIRDIGINLYRKRISCVLQEDRLFSGTLRENICGFSSKPDDEWMIFCARACCIHDMIQKMPLGYDTLIGELGEGLSGGQKQRIYIARALYRKPSILFLDEATSALDAESENVVSQSIKELNITRIIVAHRENTIKKADRVIVI